MNEEKVVSPGEQCADAGPNSPRSPQEQQSDGSWLLVYVDQTDADLIVGHSPELNRVIEGIFGEDNGLQRPKGLSRGLYRVQPVQLWEDEDNIELEGEWTLVTSAEDALKSGEALRPQSEAKPSASNLSQDEHSSSLPSPQGAADGPGRNTSSSSESGGEEA